MSDERAEHPALRAGLSREDHYQVLEEHTAPHLGSGSVPVLATPMLIAFLERSAHRLVSDHLPVGSTSVGVRIDVRHLAPTPVGGQVRVRAELVEVQGPRLSLDLQAWDAYEPIASGSHKRVVIDPERFLARVADKTTRAPGN
jgi:predicted thioesterase